MNNKGFAITGILYTIFILFIMTLLAILSGLNTRMKLMEKSIMSFQDDYSLKNIATEGEKNQMNSDKIALYDGKYIFGDNCTAYLKKGTAFSNAKYIGTNCNNTSELTLTDAYKFNQEAQNEEKD